MDKKIKTGILLLALTITIFAIRHFVGVDPDKPFDSYPQSIGVIESVTKQQLKTNRGFRSTDYYELRVRIANDSRIYFYRSPHSIDVTKLQARIHRGNSTEITYQNREDRGMHRIMNLSHNGYAPIAFESVLEDARIKNRILLFVAAITGVSGLILLGIGIEDKQCANKTLQTTSASRRV